MKRFLIKSNDDSSLIDPIQRKTAKKSFERLMEQLQKVRSAHQSDKTLSEKFRRIVDEKNGLNLTYAANFLSKTLADDLLDYCETQLTYNVGELARVKVFNQWRPIPRKQVAFGDPGLTYKFSGNTVPANCWTPVLECLKNVVCAVCRCQLNFVLVNRYDSGEDYMGEHRDNEKGLDPSAPIVSLTIGQQRDFLLRHALRRSSSTTSIPRSQSDGQAVDNVKIGLQHGSMLTMNPPTNSCWYHSLPKRKGLAGVRVNFTFRRILTNENNSAQ